MKIVTHLLSLVFITCLSLPAKSQSMTAIEVVQKQLDFYNRQDVKSFASMFADDVKVFQHLGDSLPSLQGRKAIEKRYAEIFAQYPKNHSTLLGRMVQGDFVIDHEWITGREKEMRIMAIYEVKEGLIRRCWFIR
jgi:uncharacterized protein (TIGR02246 family)